MPTQSQIICPKCNHLDMIQKVSAVYSTGIATGTYAGPSGGLATTIGSGKPAIVGGYTLLHGSSQTALSHKLAPPSKPEYKSPRDISGGLVLLGVSLLILFVLCRAVTAGEDSVLIGFGAAIGGGILAIVLY